MKKIISVLLIMIMCTASVSAFAAEKMSYSKTYGKADVMLSPAGFHEAVLVITQFKDGKMIDVDYVDVAQPDELYVSSSIVIEDGIDYEFFVYDNMNFENELYESIKINSETADRLYVDEFLDMIFTKVE